MRQSYIPLAVFLCGVVLWGCPTSKPDNGDSIKLLTFNVNMRVPEIATEFGGSNAERAQMISQNILNSDYDIVCLNEVFSDEAKDIFRSKLGPVYQSYVHKISSDDVFTQDAGLMLFSKFKFLPFGRVSGDADVDAWNTRPVWGSQVPAEIFEECSGMDCWADKGVGMVRIKNPYTGRILNVAFTHLNASYGEGDCGDEVMARNAQFGDIQALIQEVLGDAINTEDLILCGDLNVDGDQQHWELHDADEVPPGYYALAPCGHGYIWEWSKWFNTPGVFFSNPLKDAWVNENSPAVQPGTTSIPMVIDRGLTYGMPTQSERLDYILRNQLALSTGDQLLCSQHMKKDYDIWKFGDLYLSDHIPLAIDLNRQARQPLHCSPVTPFLPEKEQTLYRVVKGQITYPGSMQWHMLTKYETFLIYVSGASYELYESRDLSRPAASYYGETETITPPGSKIPYTCTKYSLPNPPVYVRVFNEDRSKTGPYDILIYQADGRDKENAIVLNSNTWGMRKFPDDMLINVDDIMWFELHIQPTDGANQSLSFTVANYFADILELTLQREDGSVVAAQTQSFIDPNPPVYETSRRLVIDLGNSGLDPGRYYLLLHRKQLQPVPFWIRWDTNLVIMHGANLGVPGACPMMVYCGEETDGAANDDEIYMSVYADFVPVITDYYLGKFDEGSSVAIEDFLPTIRFTMEVDIVLQEPDDSSQNDWFNFAIIAPSTEQRESLQGEVSDDGDDTGMYYFSYNLSREITNNAGP